MVAVVTSSLSITTAAFVGADRGEPNLSAAAVGVQVAGGVALLWRRRRPVPVWFVVGALAVVYGSADWPDPLLPFVPMVALAAVFEWTARATRTAVLAVTLAAAVAGTAAAGDSSGLDWWTTTFVVVAAPLAGAYLRTRRELIGQLRAHAELLEAQRRQELHDARRAEQLRVARDLHDVVAHHITLAVVQAEAAAASPADGSGVAPLESIAGAGRDALAELRHVIGALRDGDGDGTGDRAPTTPLPCLAGVDQLVDGLRAKGFEIDLVAYGSPVALDAAVDTAAYRVVQEALTNVVKHAADRRARVRIERRDDGVTVEVESAVDRRRPPEVAPGAGLVGLRERVALAGGTISAGPDGEGMFRVRAAFPTAGR